MDVSPRNENRNEGTFGCSPGTKTGTKIVSRWGRGVTWVLPEDLCKKDPCNLNTEMFKLQRLANPCPNSWSTSSQPDFVRALGRRKTVRSRQGKILYTELLKSWPTPRQLPTPLGGGTNVQQLTCKIDLSNSFYYLFFSFVLLELKTLCF